LLQYQYQGSDAQLDSWGRLVEIRQQLRDGVRTVLSYVHDLIATGQLDTLVQGRVWTTRNRIDQFWLPGTAEIFCRTVGGGLWAGVFPRG